jgi:hypothetical protein
MNTRATRIPISSFGNDARTLSDMGFSANIEYPHYEIKNNAQCCAD